MYSSSSASPGLMVFLPTVLIVFMIATIWRIFTKAGESGWKSLIPILNAYKMFDIGWTGDKFWVIFFGGIVLSVAGRLLAGGGQTGLMIYAVIAVVWMVYCIVISFKLAIRMAHRFGKSTAFGVVGLGLFGLIGYPILAWGSADYLASRDVGDGILRLAPTDSGRQNDEFYKY